MIRYYLLAIALAFATLPYAASLAQQAPDVQVEPAAEVPDVDVEDAEESDHESAPKIIRLHVWRVTLDRQVTAEQFEAASQPIDNGKSVTARIKRLANADLVAGTDQFVLTVRDGKEASVHQGARKPRVQGVVNNNFGRTQSIVFEDVGTVLVATATIERPSTVDVRLQFESSQLEESNVALVVPKEGEPKYATQTRQNVYSATVACPAGGAVVAMASQVDQRATIVYLAAEVLH